MQPWTTLALAFLILLAACSRPPEVREYRLTGQVLAIRPERLEIVIQHEDIQGFMPAMTMPFRVRDARWLEVAEPGEIVDARLVLEGSEAYLAEITPTGRREPLPETPNLPTVMDPPVEPGQAVPDAALIDQLGRPFTVRSLTGAPLAVTFTYTRCPVPTYCPAQDRRFRELQDAIHDRPDLAGARLLSISVDPEFDRPDVLRAHAERLGAEAAIWRFATGDQAEIERIASSLALTFVRDPSSPEEVLHSMRTAVLDTEGRLVRRYDGTDWQVGDVLRDLTASQ